MKCFLADTSSISEDEQVCFKAIVNERLNWRIERI